MAGINQKSSQLDRQDKRQKLKQLPVPSDDSLCGSITRLPDEILCAVWEEVMGEWEYWLSRATTSAMERLALSDIVAFLRSITLVSRKWHTLAAHTPRLWRVICFTRQRGTIPWTLCIERSGAVPLEAYIGNDLHNDTRALDDLSLVKHRVAYLNTAIQCLPHLSLTASPSTPGGWHRLTEVTLDMKGWITNTHRPKLTELFAMLAPHVCHLTLKDIPHQLPTEHPEATNLCFSKLEHLELINLSCLLPYKIFEWAVAPRLLRLYFFCRIFVSTNTNLCNGPLAIYQCAHLSQLCMGGCQVISEDILSFCSNLPRLERLAVFTSRYEEHLDKFAPFFRGLTIKSNAAASQIILPKLRALALYNVEPSPPFYDFIESRFRHRSPLDEVGFKEIRTIWYFDPRFCDMKEKLEIFEWVPEHIDCLGEGE